jgi:hypothetical protein
LWAKEFARWLYQTQAVTLLRSVTTGLISQPEETERDFRIRVAGAYRERRDAEAARLREKCAPRMLARPGRSSRGISTHATDRGRIPVRR